MAEAYIVEAVRTAGGRRKGALAEVHPADLGATALNGILDRSGIDPLAVEDYLDALNWAKKVGGLDGLVKRAEGNARVIAKFVRENDWIDFLAVKPKTRSNTSVCLKFTDPAVTALPADQQAILSEESFAAGKWASEATIASLADYEKKLREKGATIVEIDKAPFKAATAGVYQTLGYSDLRKDVDKALGK